MTLLSSQFLAGILRASTLALRFGLMFFLARNLPPAVVGIFGLYWAALQLASSLVTLDVYAHSSRLLLKQQANIHQTMALHMGFMVLAVFFLAPISTYVFYRGSSLVPLILLFMFIFHLPLEVISTEIGRLLIPLGKPLFSNVILFVRSALWIIPLVVAMESKAVEINLTAVVFFWVCGSILGAALALVFLRYALGRMVRPKIDFLWVRNAVLGGGYFLVATLLFRAILGLDRFLVEHFLDVKAVGIYSLFASVCLGVLGLIESSVSAWHYPKLIKFIQSRDVVAARACLTVFVRKNSLGALGLMGLIGAAFPIITRLYLDAIYFEHIEAFFIIALGVIAYCLSMPFHYVVYGFQRDRLLILNYFVGLLVLLGWSWFFMSPLGVLGAAVMLALALTSIAIGRFLQAFFLMRNFDRNV